MPESGVNGGRVRAHCRDLKQQEEEIPLALVAGFAHRWGKPQPIKSLYRVLALCFAVSTVQSVL